MAEDQERTQTDADRRRYFRIDDEIGLAVTPIAAADEAQAIVTFSDERTHASLTNELRALRDKHLPQRRSLDYKFPTVAAYVGMLERQIDMLAAAIGDGKGYAATATTSVNLSAQGLSFQGDPRLTAGALVEARLTLFPDRCHIRLLARVVRCADDPSCETTALEFSHIRDADREAIVRHVHLLQRMRLRANAEAEFDSGG